MELVDSAIFVQGLVWTTILFSGPVNHEKRLAGYFIGVVSIMTLVAYLSGYTLEDKHVLTDLSMLLLFLSLQWLLLLFMHRITFHKFGRWSWVLSGLQLLLAATAFMVRIQLIASEANRAHLLLKGCILAMPLLVVLVSLVIFYRYQLQMNDTGGAWKNRKSIVSLSLLAGLFITWILLLLSEWPLRNTGNGIQLPYWKIPLAVTLFVFGYLEISIRDQRSSRERGHGKEVDIEGVSELKKLMEVEHMYTDCELTLEKMADRLGIQPADLTRMLNQELGTSFYTLVNSYRVKEVQRKLEAEDQRYYTLLAIAFECGFNSKSTFNRVFKEFTGFTPSNYRHSAIHQTPR